MLLTLAFGLWLWLGYGFAGAWRHARLALVTVLFAHHFWLGKLLRDFRRRPQRAFR